MLKQYTSDIIMRNPHFFKAYCRIGIHNLPFGSSTVANGVEEAPDYILSDKFLNKFEKAQVSSFGFKEPEEIGPLNYFQTICNESVKFKDFLIKNHKKNETLIIIGGDHSVTFSSILYDLKTYGNELGIVHFDSHGDINLYHESPSKNFHGMYLRIFFDNFDLKYFDKLVKNKLSTNNLFYIGDLELNPEESEFINKNKIHNISNKNIKNNKSEALKNMELFINNHKHIHISFDVDVFNANLAPATGTPSKNGFNKENIFDILNIIKNAKSLTLDMAEVNPKKSGSKKTIKLAQEVITKIID